MHLKQLDLPRRDIKGYSRKCENLAKTFWSHVKEETKSKSTIGDIKDKHGNIKTEDVDRADILKDFSASVFTVEGNE